MGMEEIEAKKILEEKKNKKKTKGKSRNYDLGNGIMRFSKARMYQKLMLYKRTYKNSDKKPSQKQMKKKEPRFIKKKIGGDKNGGYRLVRIKKGPKFYPLILGQKPENLGIPRKKKSIRIAKLRSRLKPGTVCIILAGLHKGKRVIFLKQLQRSGLCLITGPFKINACPLRRINQIYLIATSVRIDLNIKAIPKHINDDYFKRQKKLKKKSETSIFEEEKKVYKVSEKRKEDQVTVDREVIRAIGKSKDKRILSAYLRKRFELRKGMYPHNLKF